MMSLPEWKDLSPQQKTQRGMYDLIKQELDKKEKPKKKVKVEIKDEPEVIENIKK